MPEDPTLPEPPLPPAIEPGAVDGPVPAPLGAAPVRAATGGTGTERPPVPVEPDHIDTAEVVMDETSVGSTGAGAPRSATPPPPPHPESTMSPWPPYEPKFENQSDTETRGASRGRRGGRMRQVLVGALAGGLVGALAATGVFLATDDNGTTTRVVEAPTKVVTRPSSTINGKLDIAAIIGKVEPAVVAITTDGGPDSGGAAGTGFVLTPDGFIATNNHVVEGSNRISVAFNDGTSKAATVKGTDPANDLAVIKVNATDLPAVTLGDSGKVQVGDDVVAIGNALALEGGLSVTQGIISGLHRQVSTDAGSALFGMLQTDAAINPGNSGGPLVNAQGQVIGINTAIANPGEAQNVGFAIPVSVAQPIIDDLESGRTPSFLGVSTIDVTAAVARERDLSVDQGALVQRVTGDSPAGVAGIKVGDVIVSIEGKAVSGSSDVLSLVRQHRPGDKVDIVVVRNGDRTTVQATLVARPDAG